jgi:cysteine desulfurase
MPTPAPIYLDHAAATPMHSEVVSAIAEAQGVAHANPSSQHTLGRAARRLLEDARERIIAALGGSRGGSGRGPHRDRLVFTSGASEANHLAVLGMTAASATVGEVFFSWRDHPSSVNAALVANRHGWRLRELALDSAEGTASAAVSAGACDGQPAGPRIVSLTLVCGQTGSIEDLPLPDNASSGLFHVDATQAVGLMPVVFHALSAATLAVAPHKFGGPRGIGALLIRGGVAIAPVQAGPQEYGLRGGTEAVPLAAGFARSLELSVADRDQTARRVASLRDRLESRLVAAARQAGIPAVVIAGGARRCPHISTIAFPGLDRQALAMAADLAGVCLATGTACASGSSEPAPALVAMGLEAALVRGAVRLSVGRTTTETDVDQAAERLTPLLRR